VIATELRRERDDAFVVRTDEADLQEVLPSLAYAREGDEEFVNRFARSDLAPATYERFAQCVPDLLAHTARRTAAPWEQSLVNLHRLLGEEWLLCGSTALAVRGVELTPRDIDLVVFDHEAAVDALGHLLIQPPRRSDEWIAEWFGRAWDGTRLEWVAGTRPDIDDHEWTSDIGPDAVRRAETVVWHGLRFAVPPLDLQLAVTRERGLLDRVAAIEAL
jgi:hypothetical protein